MRHPAAATAGSQTRCSWRSSLSGDARARASRREPAMMLRAETTAVIETRLLQLLQAWPSARGFAASTSQSRRTLPARGTHDAHGLQLEVLYTLLGVLRTARWGPYVGAGPSFSSVIGHRRGGYRRGRDEGDCHFDFKEFDWDSGFHFIVGARSPRIAASRSRITRYDHLVCELDAL